MSFRKFTAEQTAHLSTHARAVLLAFDDMDWPVFEVEIMRAISIVYTPLSLNERNAPRALDELAAAGLIEPWAPPPGADPDKPDRRLPLRRYWPPGRVWIRVGAPRVVD